MLKLIIIWTSSLILVASISIAADEKQVIKESKKIVVQKNAANDPCESSSGLGQQLCAQNKLDAADKNLNIAYKALRSKLPAVDGEKGSESGTHPQKKLIEAQRAWIKFRDANCTFVGELNGGAPVWQEAAKSNCLVKMTETRIKELKSILDEYK